MAKKHTKQARRQKIRFRIRKKVQGIAECPRLSIYKSNTALYVQIIDDTAGKTLLAADTRNVKEKNCESAKKLGGEVVEKMMEKKIAKVVFDRSGYRYHGVVRSLFETVCECMAKN